MIDPILQSELRRKFNPDGSLLRQHQLRMLEMLKYIDKICQENNIPYWVSSGTCLGVVRHGGFIPWDDDVDIEMLGKDYDRFVKIMEEQPNNQYVLQTHSNDPAYISTWGKIRDLCSEMEERVKNDRDYKFKGAFIDVFPMESFSFRLNPELIMWYSIVASLKTNKINNRVIRKTFRSILYFITLKVITPVVRLFCTKKDEHCLHHRLPNTFCKPRYIEHIFPVKRAVFEDITVNIPKDADKYLTLIFGNYMKLPELNDIYMHAANIKFLEHK